MISRLMICRSRTRALPTLPEHNRKCSPGLRSRSVAQRRGALHRSPAYAVAPARLDLDPRIRILAQAVEPATVRSLDAIHLGTALQSRPGLTSFVTYDQRLLDAAQTRRTSDRVLAAGGDKSCRPARGGRGTSLERHQTLRALFD